MREIKFRAWDKTHKRMINEKEDYSPLVITSNGIFNVIPIAQNRFGFERAPKECFELMQFTCLHDKAGKEIYEGDIVRFDEYIGIIIWKDDRYLIDWQNIDLIRNDLIFLVNHRPLFVIGNIYENPDLLKS